MNTPQYLQSSHITNYIKNMKVFFWELKFNEVNGLTSKLNFVSSVLKNTKQTQVMR